MTSPDKKENVQSRIFYSTYLYLYVNLANMVRTTLDKQISKFFKEKLQFSRTKIYPINRHPLPLLNTSGMAGVIYDFYFFSHG